MIYFSSYSRLSMNSHERILMRIYNIFLHSRIFNRVNFKKRLMGGNPRNIEDEVEIDILSQRGNTIYCFELGKKEGKLRRQLLIRYNALFLNRRELTKAGYGNFNIVRIFEVNYDKNMIIEYNKRLREIKSYNLNYVLSDPRKIL